MSIDFSSGIAVRSEVLTTEVEGQTVLLDLESEEYFGFNETGTKMWNVLRSHPSIESAYQALSATYAIDDDTLRDDLRTFVQGLLDRGLIDVISEGKTA